MKRSVNHRGEEDVEEIGRKRLAMYKGKVKVEEMDGQKGGGGGGQDERS